MGMRSAATRRFAGGRVAIVAALACWACSSGPECNQLRCPSGFEIHARSRELLAAGRYEIAVELDDVAGTCDIIFPRSTEQSSCDPGLPVTVHWQASGFVLGVFMPAKVASVRVTRDGALLGQATFDPEYRTVATDRSLCALTCEIAAPEVLSLDP
jgi:hypothetical protein